MVSIDDLRMRAESVPRALAQTQALHLPGDARTVFADPSVAFDVTGVGASEFAARLLTQELSRAGISAQFLPVCCFRSPPKGASGKVLVVFSQGLSPNAQLALESASSYRHSVLVTATNPDDPGPGASVARAVSEVLCHRPPSEAGSLVRFAGPTCSAFLALRWAAQVIEWRTSVQPSWASGLGDVATAYGAQLGRSLTPLEGDPAACIALGDETALAKGLMWKWQEALYTPLPVCCDVFSFAHGPLQSFYERPAMFVVLQPERSETMLARLRASIAPERHQLRCLTSRLPSPLSFFDYDAKLTGLIFAEMQAREVDPSNWPGKLHDGPIYSLSDPRDLDEI